MIRKSIILIIGTIAAVFLVMAVWFYPVTIVEKRAVSEVTDYSSLLDNLRALGANVEFSGEISQPFFSVEGKVITVNGERVQVFEYRDADSADTEAAQISPDGSSIGNTLVTWVDTPHFYKWDRLIVLYIGDDASILNLLQALIGDQIAGR